MKDWSDRLVDKIIPGGFGLPMTGLKKGLEGEEFEKRLGRFLRSIDAFRDIADLLEPSSTLPNITECFRTDGALRKWHQQTTFHLGQITERIRESLYENFAAAAIDTRKATDAFGQLFEVLGVTPNVPFVFATTNYDVIAATVLSKLGWLPDWGTTPMLRTGNGETDLHADGILNGMPRYAPVLHLHGRVGWYRRGDQNIEIGNISFMKEFGEPIVMLPDPNKDYGASAVINSLWAQFQMALSRAKTVLVLGHSLNDDQLVQALRQYIQPANRVAVTTYASSTASGVEIEQERHRIQTTLPGCAVVQVRFGESDTGYSELQAWRASEGPRS
jgi:hypothetical protein